VTCGWIFFSPFTEMQCPLGSVEDSGPIRSICAL
jgi:hypothetical protein